MLLLTWRPSVLKNCLTIRINHFDRASVTVKMLIFSLILVDVYWNQVCYITVWSQISRSFSAFEEFLFLSASIHPPLLLSSPSLSSDLFSTETAACWFKYVYFILRRGLSPLLWILSLTFLLFCLPLTISYPALFLISLPLFIPFLSPSLTLLLSPGKHIQASLGG